MARAARHAARRSGVRRLLLDPARAESAALARALPDTVAPVPFDRPIDAWKAELFDTIDAGFTVARSGIAATGTVVLAPDAGTPRTVSLVPPLHVALVHASTLHPDLHAAVHAERWHAACRPTWCWCLARRRRPTSSRRSPMAHTARAACGS
ncbi:Lactate utilization protein C [Burkholderia cepacia]|nr:Lactate utilization protein C [Burkholderia cepacia]